MHNTHAAPRDAVADGPIDVEPPRDPDGGLGPAWLGLLGLLLGAYAVGTDGFMIAGLLPSIASDLKTSTGAAAQLVTVFSVGYAVGAPILVSLARRVNRRLVLAVALAGLALTNAAAAVTPSLLLLFVVRGAAALAAGMYTPTAAIVAAQLVSPRRRGRALAMITGGLTLAIVTGVPLGSVVGHQLGWRATFTGIAILSAVLAVGMFVLIPRLESAAAAASLRERLAALTRPGVGRVLLTTLSGILGGYLGYTYVAPISAAMGAGSSTALAIVLVCFGIGAAIGSFLSGAGVDRYGQVSVVRCGALIQLTALVLLAAADAAHLDVGIWPAALVFLLLGIGSWTYNAPQQHQLMEVVPDNATTAVSLNSSAIYAGIGLSGAIGAATLSVGPWLNAAVGALVAAATAVIVGARR